MGSRMKAFRLLTLRTDISRILPVKRLGLLMGFSAVQHVNAENKIWNSGASSRWFTSGNWIPNSVPELTGTTLKVKLLPLLFFYLQILYHTFPFNTQLAIQYRSYYFKGRQE